MPGQVHGRDDIKRDIIVDRFTPILLSQLRKKCPTHSIRNLTQAIFSLISVISLLEPILMGGPQVPVPGET